MGNVNFKRSFLAASLFSVLSPLFCAAQPALHFKTRDIGASAAARITEIESPVASGRGHLLLQFENQPSVETIDALKRRGVDVLQDVPVDGLLVSLARRVNVQDLGVRFADPLDPADKISPLAAKGAGDGFFLIEFHPDVPAAYARGLLASSGVQLREHPDLNPRHLMIEAHDSGTLAAIARLDAVAYIFPASRALINGDPTGACVGALTANGPAAQSIPTYGDGWDGPGLGAATVGYVFTKMTGQLAPAAAQSEIERAIGEWTKAVKVTWQPGANPSAPQTVSILWGTYSHGDAYPFDGPGGVLAHTFFPAPPNPEPLAGDMHFDDSETWRIGANTDLFSVALHELGHALGLGHSDDPSAVMYPYYQMQTGLTALDIAAIQTLYAAQTGSAPNPPANPTTPAAPLSLTMNSTASTTTASSVSLSGSVSGGTGTIAVTWITSSGASGAAQIVAQVDQNLWSISSVPLAVGSNTITVTATGGATHVTQTATITRTATTTTGSGNSGGNSGGSNGDTTPPTLTITTPSSTSISTSASSIAFSGTATDNVGVTAVTWSTNTGGSGTASGTAKWSATIPLLTGSNTVTVRASDAAGNIGWRSVVVTKQ